VEIMLIEFRVCNFRSLRDEQVLTLVAAKDTALEELNTMPSGISAAPSLLRSVVLYGPNASGKSNLIKAMQYMKAVVTQSASIAPDRKFKVVPFLLDGNSSERPTEFEITLIIDGVRYQYGFKMTTQRITYEYLLVYKSAKPQKWFERTFDPVGEKYDYEFSSSLRGKKDSWRDATRPNSLFLSMAVLLNSDQLKPIYDWFNVGLTVVNEKHILNEDFSIKKLQESEGKAEISEFLTAADISISEIDVVTQKQPAHALVFKNENDTPSIKRQDKDVYELRFKHDTEEGSAVFALDDESTGTRNLLFLAGPVLDILKKGRVLMVDELDTSLHPLLVRRLVELFNNPVTNPNNAQLIFTTHDTSLLDNTLFRRDQIWFVEKDRAQASSLYPLSDFSPRKNEAFEIGYLTGRYGALPFFKNSNRMN
jgi:uncharacterized protein